MILNFLDIEDTLRHSLQRLGTATAAAAAADRVNVQIHWVEIKLRLIIPLHQIVSMP